MEWNDERIVQTLKDIRAREVIPPPVRGATVRAQLVQPSGVYLYALATRLGWLGVARSERGVRHLQLPRPTREQALGGLQREFPTGTVVTDIPREIERELREYAEGRGRSFSVALDLAGVKPFQRAVLAAIGKIPFGETRTYGWVAREIGNPKAARAVGQALHNNPIPIIIPCHRVIASDGSLGGYGGGLPMKQRLLKLEGAMLG
ncbi:MAG TPA: methylated-DNA--[protein]-cysteine S-methyltransferase [Anaerolineae bacterium]